MASEAVLPIPSPGCATPVTAACLLARPICHCAIPAIKEAVFEWHPYVFLQAYTSNRHLLLINVTLMSLSLSEIPHQNMVLSVTEAILATELISDYNR